MTAVAPPHLSPSSIATFRQCPLRWKYNKIDKIPDPSGKEALMGNFVHDVLEELYKVEPEGRSKGQAQSLAREMWSEGNWEKRIKPLVPDAEEYRMFRWKAWWCIENLWKIENPEEIEPDGLEYELNGKVSGVQLKGFIDRFTMDEGGGVVISDYKTGKVPRKEYVNERFMQLRIYGTLIDALDIGHTSSLELLYLKDGVKFEVPFSDEDITDTSVYVRSAKDDIDKACTTGDFPAQKSVLCGWCSYKNICPLWN
jgi:putative RecB family exonuclease